MGVDLTGGTVKMGVDLTGGQGLSNLTDRDPQTVRRGGSNYTQLD